MKSYGLAALMCCAGVVSYALPASAAEIYDNGPIVTHPGAHATGGADVSLAQDLIYPQPTSTLGFTAGPEYRLADDFVVPLGQYWHVNALDLFAYQLNNAAPFTDARVSIWNGPPDGFGVVKVFDGTVTNLLATSNVSAYRIAESEQAGPNFSDTKRPIQTLRVAVTGADGGNLILAAGSYWVDWQLKGAQATANVYTPPVTKLGLPHTAVGGLARFKCPMTSAPPAECAATPGGWFLLGSVGVGDPPYLVDLPFRLHGAIVIDSIFRGNFEPVPTPNP